MDALRKWRLSLPEGQRSLVAAGRLLGVSGVQMHRYETGKRRVPPEKVLFVSRVTGIPRTTLRPDVFQVPRRPRTETEQLLAVD
jgi:DNA-binding transcriptional regulator YdaS (Cro superfamily)